MSEGTWPSFEQGQNPSYLLHDLLTQVDPMFLGDLYATLSQNVGQIIPNIDQIPGYSAQTPYSATPINVEETTTSTAYTDLTTPGPLLTKLPDGVYTISWGAASNTSVASTRTKMGISINGAAVDNNMQAYTLSTVAVGVSFTTSQTIQGQSGGNTIWCKYALGATGATGTWGGRWLVAIRISGP